MAAQTLQSYRPETHEIDVMNVSTHSVRVGKFFLDRDIFARL